MLKENQDGSKRRKSGHSDSEECPVIRHQSESFLIEAFLFSYLFLYFWQCQVFNALHGLSLVVVLRLRIVVASLVAESRLWSAGSVVVVNGLSCPAACEIFPDQGSNPSPLYCQVDS